MPLAEATSIGHLAPSAKTFYGSINGTLLYGDAPAFSAVGADDHPEGNAPSSVLTGTPSGFHAGAHAPPRFYKLGFTIYDGTVDMLNWLNQCEQFFRGHCTIASDRMWLASYHLRGMAKTWY